MFLKDLFFPKFCLGCNLIGTYLCPKCQKELEYFDKDICLYCGKKSYLGFTHAGCQRENGVDGFLTIYHYNNILKKIIKAFKYRRAVDVWDDFILVVGTSNIDKLVEWKKLIIDPRAENYYIQPVPLNINRLKSRGFNQAEIIADYFNLFLKLKKINILMRKKDTKPQAQTNNKTTRGKNVNKAFVPMIKSPRNDLNIILIDDLLTTGATIKEAAETLKKRGIKRIFALTLAKG